MLQDKQTLLQLNGCANQKKYPIDDEYLRSIMLNML